MITKVETTKAPKAIGPYSQAVKSGPLLFISGTLPLDPSTGELVGHTIQEQTQQVLANIQAILEDQHLSFDHIVRADVFLKNLKDFKAFNEIYAGKLTGPVKPARQTVEVSALPLNALIEISCIASFT